MAIGIERRYFGRMSTTRDLVQALKAELKAAGITYAGLARAEWLHAVSCGTRHSHFGAAGANG